MAGTYTVRQGDFLSKIAKGFGFTDYRTIWLHPENAGLMQQRQNPNILYPGDVLFIPDRNDRVEARSTDQLHKFTKKGATLKLRLTLEDLYEKPIANAQCILSLESENRKITTDGDGKIEQVIAPDVHNAILSIQDEQTPFHHTQMPIRIGDLDPIDTISGQAARLTNLGYYFEDLDNVDAAAFSSAVEEFQCDQSLTVDGICGNQTQAKLKQVHGC